MNKRVAETLVEVVTAMTLFGVLLGGIFDFMGGQSHYIGRLGYHSRIMYGLQKYINNRSWAGTSESWTYSQDNSLGVKFHYKDNVTLTHTRYVNSEDVVNYTKVYSKDNKLITEEHKITTTTKIKYTTVTGSKNLLAEANDNTTATSGTFSFVLKDDGSTTTSKIDSVTSKDTITKTTTVNI